MLCDKCHEEINDENQRHSFSGYGFHNNYHPGCCPLEEDAFQCDKDHPQELLDEKRKEWIASRPEQVQRLINEFPILSRFDTGEGILYLLGYGEGETDTLIVSPIDPAADYEGAIAAKKYACASHFRS